MDNSVPTYVVALARKEILMDPLRRTGRTQAMLEHAMKAALDGQKVLIVCATEKDLQEMRHKVAGMVGKLTGTAERRLDVEGGGAVSFSAISDRSELDRRMQGYRDMEVFYDHHFWENLN